MEIMPGLNCDFRSYLFKECVAQLTDEERLFQFARLSLRGDKLIEEY